MAFLLYEEEKKISLVIYFNLFLRIKTEFGLLLFIWYLVKVQLK